MIITKVSIFLSVLLLSGCLRESASPIRLHGSGIKLRENRAQELVSPDGRFLVFFHIRISNAGEAKSLHITALVPELYGVFFSSENNDDFANVTIEAIDVLWSRDSSLFVVNSEASVIGSLRYNEEEKQFKWSKPE